MVEDQAKDPAEPSTPPAGEKPRKKWYAFWLSLMAALYLMTLALGMAVYTHASDMNLLSKGIRQNVDLAAVGMDVNSVDTFALLTLAYLEGPADEWNISDVVGESILPVPEAFIAHMATVRSWFAPAGAVLLVGRAFGLLLLGWLLLGFKKKRKARFSYAGYYTGALVFLAFIAGVGLWGAFDFQGMWHLLHKVLIPDGIFSASEPIMQLFPFQLFAGYAKPVVTSFGIMAAVFLIVPLFWGIKRPSSQKTASDSK